MLLIFYISLRLNPRGALPLAFEHHFALELTRLASPPFHNPSARRWITVTGLVAFGSELVATSVKDDKAEG